jgi:hypothetical protein
MEAGISRFFSIALAGEVERGRLELNGSGRPEEWWARAGWK